MARVRKNVTIDPEVWDKIQRLYPGQISNICNEALIRKINTSLNAPQSIDLELTQRLKKEAEDKLLILKEEIERHAETIELIKSELRKAEDNKLKQEKSQAEAIKTCALCKMVIENPRLAVNFKPGVIICKSCYDPASPRFLDFNKGV